MTGTEPWYNSPMQTPTGTITVTFTARVRGNQPHVEGVIRRAIDTWRSHGCTVVVSEDTTRSWIRRTTFTTYTITVTGLAHDVMVVAAESMPSWRV